MRIVGIYCYIDKKNKSIVYIGKDSNIGINKRHYAHIAPCNYDKQWINRIIQNNPEKYYYNVLLQGCISQKLLNAFEMVFIKRYNPKFNFTDGGEGIIGYKHSDKTKAKISIKNSGENHGNYGKAPWNKGKTGIYSKKTKKKISDAMKGDNHPFYGKHRSDETKQKISKAHKGKKLSEEHKKKLSESHKGFKFSEEHKRKISESLKGNVSPMKGKRHSEETIHKISDANKKNFARIVKVGKTNYGKQKYCIKKYGKIIKQSVYPFKLLDWFTANYPNEILVLKINA